MKVRGKIDTRLSPMTAFAVIPPSSALAGQWL
jgi:hypothetical protein